MRVPRVGPFIRAGVFVLVGGLAAWGPVQVFRNEAAREHAARPEHFWPVVIGSAIAVVGLCAFLVVRILREAFPRPGVRVFPVLPAVNVTVLDVVLAPVALFFLALLGLLPQLWVNPMGGFGLRSMDVTQLLLLPAMGASLLLWRPTYHVEDDRPIVRYPAGAWLGWHFEVPIRPVLEWRPVFAGKVQRQVGWGLFAVMDRFSFQFALLPVSATAAEKDAVRAEWAPVFARVKQGTPEEVRAAVAGKPVKPWHLLAAMFGLPGLVLALGTTVEPHWSTDSMLFSLGFVAVTGALSLWFLSRFLSARGLLAATLLLGSVAGVGAWRGRGEGAALERSSRLQYALTDVCKGTPSPEPAGAEGRRFVSWEGGTWRVLLGADERLSAMPREVVCVRYTDETVEARETPDGRSERSRWDAQLSVRSPATGAELDALTLQGVMPAPFSEPLLRREYLRGDPPGVEAMGRALDARR